MMQKRREISVLIHTGFKDADGAEERMGGKKGGKEEEEGRQGENSMCMCTREYTHTHTQSKLIATYL